MLGRPPPEGLLVHVRDRQPSAFPYKKSFCTGVLYGRARGLPAPVPAVLGPAGRDNPFSARGYRADVEVLPDSEGKDLCFARWNATWDAGLAPTMAALSANIRAVIAGAGPSASL
jgi:hypothetical protein